jgi:hypothetical protein
MGTGDGAVIEYSRPGLPTAVTFHGTGKKNIRCDDAGRIVRIDELALHYDRDNRVSGMTFGENGTKTLHYDVFGRLCGYTLISRGGAASTARFFHAGGHPYAFRAEEEAPLKRLLFVPGFHAPLAVSTEGGDAEYPIRDALGETLFWLTRDGDRRPARFSPRGWPYSGERQPENGHPGPLGAIVLNNGMFLVRDGRLFAPNLARAVYAPAPEPRRSALYTVNPLLFGNETVPVAAAREGGVR